MARKGAGLGQHFLTHAWAARKLAYAVTPRPGETILEIGPGKGVLTKELLALGSVVAIEKDEKLVEKLHETFAEDIASEKLKIVSADIRDVTPERLGLDNYVLAANIPYYITGEIIRQFLTAEVQPRAMALLVQKEVAQRVVDTKESILSLSVKAYGTPKVIAKVRKPHFSPPPSVDSAILLIDNISRKFFADISEDNFFKVVRTGFASKRKMLVNNLLSLSQKADVLHALNACSIAKNTRAEKVSLEEWRCLTKRLS